MSTWTWADLRKGAEAMNPFAYFRFRYYEKWLGGISGYFVAKGYITAEELDAKTAEYLADPRLRLPDGGDRTHRRPGHPLLREGDSPRAGRPTPRFAVGDRRARQGHPAAPTTPGCPATCAAAPAPSSAVFEGDYGYFCSTGPDGLGEPMPVYAVRFDPADIWGELAEPGAVLYAELYQAYLTHATEEQQ